MQQKILVVDDERFNINVTDVYVSLWSLVFGLTTLDLRLLLSLHSQAYIK